MKFRMVITLLTTLLLGFITVGSMKEIGQIIKYPASTIMMIDKYTGNDKTAALNEINRLAKESHITIYIPFVTDSGETKTAELGAKQAYVTDLQNRSITGNYYLDSDSQSFEQAIQADSQLSSTFSSLNLIIFPTYVLSQSASAPSLWILFFVYFVSAFAVEMSLIKRGMIHRSLGRFGRYAWVNVLLYLGFLTASAGLVIAFFAVTQGSLDSIYVKGFALTLAISALLLMLLSLAANLLFMLVVKLSDISSILKHRYVNRLGSLIYLGSILASVILFAQSVNATMATASQLSDYQQTLSMWKNVSAYVKPSLDSGDSSHTNADHMVDHTFMLQQTQKEINFFQSLSDTDFIFVNPSGFDSFHEETYQAQASQKGSGLILVKTDSRLSPQTLYVSRGFILLNQKLYPQNSYGTTNADKLVTLYIPQSLKGSTQTIENNVIAENFADLTTRLDAAQFQVNIIPDNQETFLLFKPSDSFMSGSLPEQTARNKILIQINYQKLASISPNILRVIGSNTLPYGGGIGDGGNLLIRQSVLVPQLKAQGLNDQLTGVDKVSSDAALLAQTVAGQLQGSLMVLLAITLSSVFILWQYLASQYQRVAKSLVIHHIFSGESWKQEIVLLLPLLIGTFLAAAVGGYLIHSSFLFVMIFVLYVLEILNAAAFNHYRLKYKRVQTVKDSLE